MRSFVMSLTTTLLLTTGFSAASAATNACGGGADVDTSKGLLGVKAEHSCPPNPPKNDDTKPRLSDQPSQPVGQLTDEQRARSLVELLVCLSERTARGEALSACYYVTGAAAGAVVAGRVTAPQVTAQEVRESAVGQLRFSSPKIGASACVNVAAGASCTGTVGVPVWLWVGDGNRGLPSDSTSATAGPYSIKATAKVSKVKWSLGDGQSTICSGTGTKYDPDAHGWSSPHCGFKDGWKQAGTYTLTASYVWDISWSGDQTGSATQVMSTTRQVTVGELQAVAKPAG